jgi:hypothetical protein
MKDLPRPPEDPRRRLQREEITLPDGRRLVYYRFPEAAPRDPAPEPGTEER